jgi:hypothetical protein
MILTTLWRSRRFSRRGEGRFRFFALPAGSDCHLRPSNYAAPASVRFVLSQTQRQRSPCSTAVLDDAKIDGLNLETVLGLQQSQLDVTWQAFPQRRAPAPRSISFGHKVLKHLDYLRTDDISALQNNGLGL